MTKPFKKDDYVRYSSPFLRDVAGVGQILSINHDSGMVTIKWSNQDVGNSLGLHREFSKYLELVPEEDIPMAVLGTL